MGGSAGLWARRHVEDLPAEGRAVRAARDVLFVAALSCIDETGFLSYSMARLADECRLSVRMTQEAVRLLSRLEFLVQGDRGFRLARYVSEVQSGATSGGTKFRALRGRDSQDSLDTLPSPEEELKPCESPAREERAGGRALETDSPKKREREPVSPELLARVWAPVLGKLVRDREGAPQFRGFTDYEALELLELGREVVVGCPVELTSEERAELGLKVARAAIETGMSRGRVLRIVASPVLVFADFRSP